MSPSTPAATSIPRWPKITVALHADGSGRLTIDGRDEDLSAGDIDDTRRIVLERVAATALTVGRPVRLHSSDPDGRWELAVHPDGQVDELAAHPATAAVAPAPELDTVAAAVRAPQPSAHSTPPARQRRRSPVRAAVALALLAVLASAAALVLTNGPATVVRGSAPITPINDTAPPDEAGRAAVVASGYEAAQRRQAAREQRRRRAALQQRVAARQARERRAARRRATARRAASRRRSAPAPQPARTTRPAPRAAREFAPAPPPACGEFDLC